MNFKNLPAAISLPTANIIAEVVSIFENGSRNGNYDAYVAYKDKRIGDNYFRQITYGRFQTTEFGHLKKLIQMYVDADGVYKDFFIPYLPLIGKMQNETPISLYLDNGFVDKLKLAASDPIMQNVQEDFFDLMYFQPALSWFKTQGFSLPVSLLVIFDSYIHSGGILKFLRNRFAEYPPLLGGDEKKWITQYVAARHAWLANYETPEVRASKYRTQTFKNLIAQNNWDLQMPFVTQGIAF